MDRTLKTFASLLLLAISESASAHPDHGETEGFSVIHYISEPTHWLTSVVALGLLLFSLTRLLSRRSKEENA